MHVHKNANQQGMYFEFFGIGKGKVLKVINDGHRLNKLVDVQASMKEVFEEASAFVMACHGILQVDNMSLARYNVWLAKNK